MVLQALRHTGLNLVSTVLVRGMGFLLIPVYTRCLSPSDYGVIDLLALCTTLCLLTVALEISQGLVRLLPEQSSVEERRHLVSTALLFTLGANTVLIIVCGLFARPLAIALLKSEQASSLIWLFGTSTAFQGVVVVWQTTLRAAIRPVRQALLSLCYGVLTLAGTVLAVVWWNWGMIGVLFGQLCAGVGAALLGAYWTRDLIAWTFVKSKLEAMLKFSLPLVPSSLAVWVGLYVDRVALQHLTNMSELGIFGVAARFASIGGIVGLAMQSSILPLIYQHYRAPTAAASIGSLFRLYCGVSLSAITGLALLSGEIIAAMTAPPYYGAASLITPLVIATLANQMLIFAPGLTIAGRTGMYGLLNVVAALTNTILAFALIPRWGAAGAAFGTCFSALLGCFVHVLISQRFYYIPFRLWRLLPGTMICALSLLAAPPQSTVAVSSHIVWKGLVALVPVTLVLLLELLSERRVRRGTLLSSHVLF
ncbi:MAG: oligosaccharide flippase family protein [Verrucomicrobiales bacterium]